MDKIVITGIRAHGFHGVLPQEKAAELVGKFIPYVRLKMGQEDFMDKAKQCSLIAVDEIILCYSRSFDDDWYSQDQLQYWQEVKQEIEKL